MKEGEQKLWDDYNACGRIHGSKQEALLLDFYTNRFKLNIYKYISQYMKYYDDHLKQSSFIGCQVFLLQEIRKHDGNSFFFVSVEKFKYRIIDFYRKEVFNSNIYTFDKDDKSKIRFNDKDKEKIYVEFLSFEHSDLDDERELNYENDYIGEFHKKHLIKILKRIANGCLNRGDLFVFRATIKGITADKIATKLNVNDSVICRRLARIVKKIRIRGLKDPIFREEFMHYFCK